MLSEKLIQSVQRYIDEHYTLEKSPEGYASAAPGASMSTPGVGLPAQTKRLARLAEESMAAAMAVPMAAPVSMPDLEKLLRETDAGFSETLLALIDRAGKKDAEIYKRANIDRKLFSKIRCDPDYKPSKATALALAIALELDLDETRDLIGRAGYALSHSSKFDLIVEFFIVNGNYSVGTINEALYKFDQPILGAR